MAAYIPKPLPPRALALIEATERVWGVPRRELLRPGKDRLAIRARRLLAHLMRQECGARAARHALRDLGASSTTYTISEGRRAVAAGGAAADHAKQIQHVADQILRGEIA